MTPVYPHKWILRPLGECGNWVSGGTPSTNNPLYWNGDIPWISAKSLRDFEVEDSEDRVTREGATSGTKLVPAGTVLFVVRGMSLAKEFRVGVTRREVAFNQDLRGIVPYPDVDARFLARYLCHAQQSILTHADNAAHGTRRLPTDLLAAVPVPLPPLGEQKRITAILDQADAIRRKRRAAAEATAALIPAGFCEMFGDPGKNPRHWPIVEMREVVRETQYGTSSALEVEKRRYPVLRMNNITYSGDWQLNDLKWLDFGNEDVAKYTVRRGDLLFNRTNSPELVGKTAVWPYEETYGFAGYLIRVRFDESRVLPKFVSSYLNSRFGKSLLFKSAIPSNNMSNISASTFRRLPLMLPPVEMQEKFADYQDQVQESTGRQRIAEDECDALFHSLVHRAFCGEL